MIYNEMPPEISKKKNTPTFNTKEKDDEEEGGGHFHHRIVSLFWAVVFWSILLATTISGEKKHARFCIGLIRSLQKLSNPIVCRYWTRREHNAN